MTTKKKTLMVRDAHFKYMIQGEDNDANYIKKVIIETILGIKYTPCINLSTNIVNEQSLSKGEYMDWLGEDENSNLIHMEMQCSRLHVHHRSRFENYILTVYKSQFKAGDPKTYHKHKPVQQIIFVDDHDSKHKNLIERISKYVDGQKEDEFQSVLTYIVYLSVIDDVLKHKRVEDLTEFEAMMYYLSHDVDDLTGLEDKKGVLCMARKSKYFNEEFGEMLARMSREDYIRTREIEKQLLEEQRVEIEENRIEIENQRAEIEENRVEIQRKDALIEEKDALIGEKDALIGEKDADIEKSNNLLKKIFKVGHVKNLDDADLALYESITNERPILVREEVAGYDK